MASMAHDPAATPPATQQRAIRFVSNNDGPYAKRRRINAACLTCRRRKTRCSGERPACETCLRNNHSCAGYGPDSELTPTATEGREERRTRRVSTDTQSTERRTLPASRRQPSQHQQYQQQPEHSASSRASLDHLLSPESSNLSDPYMLPSVDIAQSVGDDSQAASTQPPLSLSIRNRMPYFRYFGPTAIMPGFKQMVVKVKGKQHSTAATSTDGLQSPPPPTIGSLGQVTPQHTAGDTATPVDIPLYDTSSVAPPPLITHLCKTFFSHLGCNFPFLQQERFMRDLEEKQVDAILVDSVCTLAARFSTDPMLTGTGQRDGERDRSVDQTEVSPSEYGQAFAQRAKSAIADTFSCPSVAVVQAALLLAYDEFGASRDSGLWMYLGIAIRMAQDLGMQTLQGLKYEGRDGPTPESVRTGAIRRRDYSQQQQTIDDMLEGQTDPQAIEDQKAVERERVDTFWTIFFLDRVVSSGTGRPVSLRDKDIEISFPSLDAMDPTTGWPIPFPALIRVIHLYGRVTDLLNSIREVSDVTPDVIKRLASMETQLTDIYQNLSSRLHFNVLNFQHYLKTGQGTNFILLHFWFHTLIVLLHQPTLLKTFEGGIQQLLPNSHELSMSSAKTIADILAFAELADAKAGLGNPFTSQPIYIAACAFLKETAMQTASSNPHSRQATPPGGRTNSQPGTSTPNQSKRSSRAGSNERKNGQAISDKQMAKHTLLATAANQNYQRCYKALQSLETYWAGIKYILTVLDQKAKGVGDPLLYTREEMECALEMPRPEPSFITPGWRRKLSWGAYIGPTPSGEREDRGPVAALKYSGGPAFSIPGSPIVDPGQAIGWSLTGTMNSPSTSLAVLYPTEPRENSTRRAPHESINPSISGMMGQPSANQLPHNLISGGTASTSQLPSPQSMPASSSILPRYHGTHQLPSLANMPPPQPPSNASSSYLPDPSLVSDADLLLNLHSPFSATTSPRIANAAASSPSSAYQAPPMVTSSSHAHSHPHLGNTLHTAPPPAPEPGTAPNADPAAAGANAYVGPIPFGDMLIESQDIDMSALGDNMVPWLEYLPHDMLNFFDTTATAGATTVGAEAEEREGDGRREGGRE